MTWKPRSGERYGALGVIAVDTNIVVRLLARDDEMQYQASRILFETQEIFIPDTVVLELEWVLRYAYNFSPSAGREALVGRISSRQQSGRPGTGLARQQGSLPVSPSSHAVAGVFSLFRGLRADRPAGAGLRGRLAGVRLAGFAGHHPRGSDATPVVVRRPFVPFQGIEVAGGLVSSSWLHRAIPHRRSGGTTATGDRQDQVNQCRPRGTDPVHHNR